MALVRQMVLIDSNGNPVRTQLTESVQMRVYRAIHHVDRVGTGTHFQDFFEFRMSRKRLLSEQAGGLRAVAPEEKEFSVVHSQDIFQNDVDPARWGSNVLLRCSTCHEFAGIQSFLSYSRARFGAGVGTPPKLVESNPDFNASGHLR